jgi:hypothetical protein
LIDLIEIEEKRHLVTKKEKKKKLNRRALS